MYKRTMKKKFKDIFINEVFLHPLSVESTSSCKSSHNVAFRVIKSSRFAGQCCYNMSLTSAIILFICSLFLNIGIFIFSENIFYSQVNFFTCLMMTETL